ncbi:hypothetical protein TSTA_091530 [Talaromyces stipitatus ATCC 10500]|uniref:BTB domain-containing protein n=1 Tax=Talaromyces stipitatus (strain ATCC 10500 / CBS 375.48 / QM 6759 / NRRL 1006) TaxID=441959 RepID=B8M2K1_TALSN|nr:uncharacterized protein TSTA_091530 [Talaromyces stipitatus ATCC 10500]EED21912.1 hypothetical protein TSTA_091530 [Talaromyces stipitatus ATCC 10500]
MSTETNISPAEPSQDNYESHGQHPTTYLRSRHHRISNDSPYFFRSLIWGIYKNRQYTDFVIRVKGSVTEFHVHRAVICPQSGIFEAACRGSFIEASTNSITLTDDDPEIVERMIRYLYTHRYDDAEDWGYDCCDNGIKRIRQHYSEMDTGIDEDDDTNDNDEDRHISRSRRHGHVNSNVLDRSSKGKSSPTSPPKSLHVYAIADKYLIHPLKDLAQTRFTNWVYSHWWTMGFVAAAREIFDNETGNYNDLKEVILSTITLHADTLLCGGTYSRMRDGQEEMDKFMQDYNEVSMEVLRRTLDRTRVRQRGLEVGIADLESRVKALRVENKKVAVLQSRNNSLNKELLDIKMVVLAWKRDLKDLSSSSTGRRGGQDISPS